MENFNRNKKLRLLLVLICLLILIMGVSFAWLGININSSRTNIIKAGTLSLELNEKDTEGINLDKAIPMSDTKGLTQEGYTFKLTNNGKNATKYTIYLDDLDLQPGETRMPDSVVKYNLTKNDVQGSSVLLTSIGTNPNRIVDTGIIEANTTNTYTLKLWMDYEAKIDVMDTVFYAKLRVEAEQDNIKVEESDVTLDVTDTNQKLDLEGDISNYTIESSDPSIATVDSEGNIIPTGHGTVTFTTQDKTTGARKNITVTISKTLTATYLKQTGVDQIERETDTCKLSDKNQTTCSITLPSITASSGYNVVGWNKDKTAHEGKINTMEISEDTTLYTIAKKDEITYTATFTKPSYGVTHIGNQKLSCTIDSAYNDEEQATSCKITLPTITPEEGYTAIGWSDVGNATTGTPENTEIEINNNKEFFAIVKKNAITLSAKFYKNGAASLDGSTEEFITKTCVLEEKFNGEAQATECTITTPTIVASSATPNILGFNENQDSTTAGIGANEELVLTSNITYYAITKSNLKTYTATFYKNGASTLDGSNDEYVTKQCNIASTYNGVAQQSTCEITSPQIVGTTKTPTVIGYSTSSDDHTSVWGSNELNNISESANYYAQTKKDEIIYTATYKVGTNVDSIGTASNPSCTIDAVYNGSSQGTSCSVEGPSITPKAGYTSVGWSETNGATTGSTLLELTKDTTFYANATANSYIVEYYDENTKLGTSGVKVDESLTLTTISALDATKEGYSFKGWATSLGSNVVAYNDGATVSNLSTTEGAIVKLYGIYIDDIKPACTAVVENAKINTTGTTNITYTCTDLGSGISPTTLTASNFTIDNPTIGQITSVSPATEVTAGKSYKYTVTVKGLSVGKFNVSLNEGIITDNASNTNDISTTTDITVEGITYTAKFEKGDNVTGLSSTTLSCTTTGSNTECSIDLPTITAASGYVPLGWFLKTNSTTTPDIAITENKYTLNASNTTNNEITLITKVRVAIASEVSFDNTITGYDCTDIQCAIDELNKEFQ